MANVEREIKGELSHLWKLVLCELVMISLKENICCCASHGESYGVVWPWSQEFQIHYFTYSLNSFMKKVQWWRRYMMKRWDGEEGPVIPFHRWGNSALRLGWPGQGHTLDEWEVLCLWSHSTLHTHFTHLQIAALYIQVRSGENAPLFSMLVISLVIEWHQVAGDCSHVTMSFQCDWLTPFFGWAMQRCQGYGLSTSEMQNGLWSMKLILLKQD